MNEYDVNDFVNVGRVPYKATPDKGLIRLMVCMGEALRTISFKVRTASCGGTACVNSFGDEHAACCGHASRQASF
jgi:hypothetical protein